MDRSHPANYLHQSAEPSCASRYLWPVLIREMEALDLQRGTKVFDLGCGNGTLASLLQAEGFDVTGVDPSASGIERAKSNCPAARLEIGSAYDDLAAQYGQFSLAVSLEVIEHVFDPRHYARTLFQLVEPGGVAIISTPYHGYIKNVALAVSGQLESHFTVLWDGGHIKFFSMRTLGILLRDAGFIDIRFVRIGRIPVLAKSMMAIARKSLA